MAALLCVRASAAFRARYLQDSGERTVDGLIRVCVDDVPFGIFCHVVQYLYTDDLAHVDDRSDLDAIFRFSSKLDMHTLAEHAIRRLGGGRAGRRAHSVRRAQALRGDVLTTLCVHAPAGSPHARACRHAQRHGP